MGIDAFSLCRDFDFFGKDVLHLNAYLVSRPGKLFPYGAERTPRPPLAASRPAPVNAA
jgi:hypothetical protein